MSDAPAARRRRVLFIAYLYPPIANSGTRRSLTFANRLPEFGWDPVVLTLDGADPRRCDLTLLAEVRPGTRVERVPLGARARAEALAGWFPHAAGRQRLVEALAWRLEVGWDVPDVATSWQGPAVARGLALLREQPFDAIYASGWPWSAFCVADTLSRRTGVPCLLDYRDLWAPTGTHAWETQSRTQRWFNPTLEHRIGRRAAAVVTVTDSLVQAIGGALGRPVECITNGYEPEDFAPSPRSVDPGAPVRLAYTGVWRPGYGLEDLYRALQRLKAGGSPAVARLRVDAAGFAPGPAREFGVEDLVHECGPVPHERALALMQAADAQVLTVPEGYYARASLPGKLFEYLGSASPVLALVPADSEVARVLGDVGGALRLDPGDVAGLAAAIERIAERTPGTFAPQRPERLERFTRRATTAQLAAVLDRIARPHPAPP